MQSERRRGTIRRLALFALIGQLLWVGFILLGGLFEPGYSEVRDAVSFLGARTAASPWVFDTVVAIVGLATIALAAALKLDGPAGPRGRLGPGLIALTGAAQVLDGFPFPADCRETIDAGCHALELAGEVSWRHEAHGWAYFLGAGALMLSVFAMAWRFHGDERWRLRLPRGSMGADRVTLGAGIIAIVFFFGLFFVIGDEPTGHYGLIQRIVLLAGTAWTVALAAGLLDLYGPRRLLGRPPS